MKFGWGKKDDTKNNFKFKEIKVYSSNEWMAYGGKKYRQVFENTETSYMYFEVSLYNKLFDEEDWEISLTVKGFQLEPGNKRRELCSLDLSKKVSKEENIIYFPFQNHQRDLIVLLWNKYHRNPLSLTSQIRLRSADSLGR